MYYLNYFFEDVKSCKHQLPPKKWIKLCLKKEGYIAGNLNFIFCSDKYLKRLNVQYLNKSYLTDVIAFNSCPPLFTKGRDAGRVFGDIFISIERVKANKTIYKSLFSQELRRVMIHGVLHLIGYKDHNKKETEIMRKKEQLYINLTN
jgi:probable rRNA maturation factor